METSSALSLSIYIYISSQGQAFEASAHFLFFLFFLTVRNEFNESDNILTNLKTTKMISKNKYFHKRSKTKKVQWVGFVGFFAFSEKSNESNNSDKILTNSQTVKTTKMISKNKHFHKRPKTKKVQWSGLSSFFGQSSYTLVFLSVFLSVFPLHFQFISIFSRFIRLPLDWHSLQVVRKRTT